MTTSTSVKFLHSALPGAPVLSGTVGSLIAVLDACRELGTAFVAFSPVARGFLCGELTDVATLHPADIRRAMPRFAPENYAAKDRKSVV